MPTKKGEIKMMPAGLGNRSIVPTSAAGVNHFVDQSCNDSSD
jgi:hypothetical protein